MTVFFTEKEKNELNLPRLKDTSKRKEEFYFLKK